MVSVTRCAAPLPNSGLSTPVARVEAVRPLDRCSIYEQEAQFQSMNWKEQTSSSILFLSVERKEDLLSLTDPPINIFLKILFIDF